MAMSPGDLDALKRRGFVMAMAPAIDPPDTRAIWKLAFPYTNYVECTAPPHVPAETNLRIVLENSTRVVTRIRDVANLLRQEEETVDYTQKYQSSFGPAAFPYICATRFKLDLGLSDPPVCVAQSPIHGSGVFATRDLKPNELVTTYPADGVRILMDLAPRPTNGRERLFITLYHDPAITNANPGACYAWLDYEMNGFKVGRDSDGTPGVMFYGNPEVHPPKMCGHMINDPKGTGRDANCVACPLVGGAVTAILITSPVQQGDELLLKYGPAYWAARD